MRERKRDRDRVRSIEAYENTVRKHAKIYNCKLGLRQIK
jgi:hypothetical protein